MPQIEFPEKLRFLFEPHPYKIIYGGRDGIKSWSTARALVLMGTQRPLRVLCAREQMNSLEESVHKLLSDQIGLLGVEDFYKIEKGSIFARDGSGTQFSFEGLRNTQNLKSYEGFDICWVEEAANVSRSSWEILLPTIRKPGSEIWVTFNPRLRTDETYQRFVLHPPPGAVAVKTTYEDNKWLSAESRGKIEHLRATNYDRFLEIYGGNCQQTLEGAIYAAEIREATAAQRITRVPHDPAKPVHTFWDLGYSDCTSIWFVQSAGFEHRVIDFYQNRQQALPHYLNVLQSRGYVYGFDHLPHDARARQLGTGKSIEELMRAATRKVKIVPSISIADGINAVRTLFPLCWFDEEKTAAGMDCLRCYQYEVDAATKQYSRKPLHNDASHAADAFRMFAVGLRPERVKMPEPRMVIEHGQMNPYGFMG